MADWELATEMLTSARATSHFNAWAMASADYMLDLYSAPCWPNMDSRTVLRFAAVVG